MTRAFIALIVLWTSLGIARADLHRDLDAIREASTIPVLAYAVIRDGAVVERGVLGDAPKDARFRAGSVSKTVTTMMILSLVADGTLSLNMPVADTLGAAAPRNDWEATAPLRLVHLLEQTSGLPGTSYADYGNRDPRLSPSTVAVERDLTTRWPPGQFFSYANVNHTLAAAMAERVTGESFDDLVRQRVFEPLGMAGATFRRDRLDGATLLSSVDAAGRSEGVWDLAVRPSGALIAAIDDLAALSLFLAMDGGSAAAIPPDLVRRMRAPETSLVAGAGYPMIYGAGLFPFVEGADVFFGHWGRIDGFQTVLATSPETGAGFVLIANGGDRQAFGAARRRLSEEVSSGIDPTVPPDRADDLARYGGWWLPFTDDSVERAWISQVLGLVRVGEGPNRLKLRAGLPPWSVTELEPSGAGQFRLPGFPIPTHVFAPDRDGELFMLGDQQLSFRRIGGVEAAFRLVLPVIVLIAAPILVVGGGMALVRRVRGHDDPSASAWMWFGLMAMLFVALLGLHVLWGMLAPLSALQGLSEATWRSLALAGLSLAWPMAGLAGSVALWRRLGAVGRVSAAFLIFVAGSFGIIAVHLSGEGWVPLVTWV